MTFNFEWIEKKNLRAIEKLTIIHPATLILLYLHQNYQI